MRTAYSVDFRKKVVRFVHNGGGQAEAARYYEISLWCVRDWLARPDLQPQQKDVPRQRKLDKETLKARIRDNPDATLQEHAVYCGVERSVIGKALKRMNITRKKRRSNTKNVIRKSA